MSGRFTTTDSMYGGNANPYGYPSAPTSDSDLNGQTSCKTLTTTWQSHYLFMLSEYLRMSTTWCYDGVEIFSWRDSLLAKRGPEGDSIKWVGLYGSPKYYTYYGMWYAVSLIGWAGWGTNADGMGGSFGEYKCIHQTLYSDGSWTVSEHYGSYSSLAFWTSSKC